jgi:hypothetical protein
MKRLRRTQSTHVTLASLRQRRERLRIFKLLACINVLIQIIPLMAQYFADPSGPSDDNSLPHNPSVN